MQNTSTFSSKIGTFCPRIRILRFMNTKWNMKSYEWRENMHISAMAFYAHVHMPSKFKKIWALCINELNFPALLNIKELSLPKWFSSKDKIDAPFRNNSRDRSTKGESQTQTRSRDFRFGGSRHIFSNCWLQFPLNFCPFRNSCGWFHFSTHSEGASEKLQELSSVLNRVLCKISLFCQK